MTDARSRGKARGELNVAAKPGERRHRFRSAENLPRLDVLQIFLGDSALLLIARMEVKTITERDAFTGRHGEISGGFVGQLFEIVPAKRVGGEQAVIAHVPPGRVARVL